MASGGAQSRSLHGSRIGFTLENQFRKEENDGTGGVVGSYGVRTGDGCLRVTRYKATQSGGFKVVSTNKQDCDVTRVQSRLNPLPPYQKKPQPARPIQPPRQHKSPATQPPTIAPRIPNQPSTASPRTPDAPKTLPPVPVDIDSPVVEAEEIQVLVASPTTGRPHLKGIEPQPKAPSKPTPKAASNPNRNRPKQLKKDFDFKALSAGNPARALDKKDDPVYSFGFTAPGHGHTQEGLSDGRKKGEYYFDSPDGWRRIVTYEANEKGFFPKMRRIRIPGWTSTTPAPRVSRNRNRPSGGGSGRADPNDPSREGGLEGPEDVNQAGEVGGGTDRAGGSGGSGGNGGGSGGSGGIGGSGGKRDGSGGTGGSGGSGGSGGDGDLSGKQLLDGLRNAGVGSCPYYFFYNTKVNFHWERCMENGTKVGQYGRLHEDGFSYRTSYYADSTGYHPKSTKVALTPEQRDIVHDFTEGVFILPKTDEERRDTEQRILDWLEANRELLADPLRA